MERLALAAESAMTGKLKMAMAKNRPGTSLFLLASCIYIHETQTRTKRTRNPKSPWVSLASAAGISISLSDFLYFLITIDSLCWLYVSSIQLSVAWNWVYLSLNISSLIIDDSRFTSLYTQTDILIRLTNMNLTYYVIFV